MEDQPPNAKKTKTKTTNMNATISPEAELQPLSQPQPAPAMQTHPASEPPLLKILDSPSEPSPLCPQSESLTPPLKTRVGKIARLPIEIREHVNELLRAGRTYNQVVAALTKLGFPGISERNICNWKHGGYVDWLRERQQAEARLTLPKALEHCVRSGDIDRIQQNALVLAADHLMMIMGQFDHTRAVALLYEKPELFPRYVAAIGALGRCSTDLSKSFDLTQNRETLIREKLAVPEVQMAPAPADLDDDADTLPNPKPPLEPVAPPSEPTQPPNPELPAHCRTSNDNVIPLIVHETPEAPPVSRLDPNQQLPPFLRVPGLTVERTTAELLNLLRNGRNGYFRKATVTNGSQKKATEGQTPSETNGNLANPA